MSETTRGRFDGWLLYLVVLVCLVPVVVPSGPARTALVDVWIVLGMGAFVALVLARREPVQVPFLGPVILMAVGSLMAVVNAESPAASFLTMTQDAYLYLWLIMLVHLLRRRDLRGIHVAWVCAAMAVAALGIALVLTQGGQSLADLIKPRGRRAYGTFYDANMFASYLVMSLFIVLGLGQQVGRLFRWSAFAVLTSALIATKSNGGMLSLVVGLAAWALARAHTRSLSPVGLVGAVLLIGSLALTGLWMSTGLGMGAAHLRTLQSQSFLARASHSSEGRFKIWNQLQRTYAKSPLGIGPGNSRHQTVSVEDRVRPNSLQAKEAHNDYLAYAIERGPLALLGLLALLGQAFGKIAAAWRRRDRPEARGPAVGPLAAAVAGALVAASVHALTIEIFHFRHFWMLLAFACALERMPAPSHAEAPSRSEPLAAPGARRVAPAGA